MAMAVVQWYEKYIKVNNWKIGIVIILRINTTAKVSFSIHYSDRQNARARSIHFYVSQIP